MIRLRKYKPHLGQQAFHYYIDNVYRYIAMICGIRGGKTYSGARQALKMSWNARGDGVFGIIAPTYPMLKRTTWREFRLAARAFIKSENIADKIIVLKNGREVHGFSADKADKIRNATLNGFWLDEGRECKEGIWEILLGRVLSTNGKGILTTSPNSFDWIYETFVDQKDPEYGLIHFPTYENTYLKKEAIESLERKYDERFAKQEIHGQFVVFEGAVYYTFNRKDNAGDLAFKVAQYNPSQPLGLCCDFNVDPMAWVIVQKGVNGKSGLDEVYAIDEIYLRNANTPLACKVFKERYPNHKTGVVLYGDATGKARHTSSNVTNWAIIRDELKDYGIEYRVPLANPAERDRINAVNGLICNSKGERRLFANPEKCKHLIRDFEQVPYKEGTTQIDKNKNLLLTHPSDAIGYMVEKDYSIRHSKMEGLKI